MKQIVKLYVSHVGCRRDGRDGRECALREFSEKGGSNRKGFLGKEGLCCVLKIEKNGRHCGLEGKYFK